MLSQDFYRFIWDGELLLQGINPYLHTPDAILQNQITTVENRKELYNGMGELSAMNFSNYPPLNQLIFGFAALFTENITLGGIITMRLIIILADVGVLYFGRKLLQKLNKSSHLIFWYFLNPLVIIELTGNLHFEGVMLFFFVWAMYLLAKGKWLWAAPILACSIAIKLVPLLFLPLFIRHLDIKKAIPFYAIIGIVLLGFFFPFYASEFIDNYSKTIGLWFSNFEFNASIYNGVKHLALNNGLKNYEIIKSYGKVLPYIVIGIVLLFSFLRNNKKITTLFTSMFWVLCLYYFISTTVHPWYIIFLLVLGIYTNYRFMIIWSAAALLSYWAYSQPDFKENLWILSLEYIAVIGFLLHELLRLHRQKLLFPKEKKIT